METKQEPILKCSLMTKLKSGEEVEVLGEVFENKIFPRGETEVYSKVTIQKTKHTKEGHREPLVRWIGYYPLPMTELELQNKVNEVAEGVDDEFYLFEHLKRKNIN